MTLSLTYKVKLMDLSCSVGGRIKWNCMGLLSGHTEYHRQGGLNNRNLFSRFWRLVVRDEGFAGLLSFKASLLGLLMTIFLQCLHMAFPVCLSLCSQISSSYKETSNTGLGPTLMTLFYLNYFFKGPIFQYSHILRYLGLGYEFGGHTVQPITGM